MDCKTSFLLRYRQLWFEKPWYGKSISTLVADISDADAQRKFDGIPSIAQQGMHMLAWQNFILEKLDGNATFDITMDSSVDWHIDSKPLEWSVIYPRLVSSANSIITKVETLDISNFDETVPGNIYTLRWMLDGIIQHDLCHASQIITTYKLIYDSKLLGSSGS